jgi:hypothetical protein
MSAVFPLFPVPVYFDLTSFLPRPGAVPDASRAREHKQAEPTAGKSKAAPGEHQQGTSKARLRHFWRSDNGAQARDNSKRSSAGAASIPAKLGTELDKLEKSPHTWLRDHSSVRSIKAKMSALASDSMARGAAVARTMNAQTLHDVHPQVRDKILRQAFRNLFPTFTQRNPDTLDEHNDAGERMAKHRTDDSLPAGLSLKNLPGLTPDQLDELDKQTGSKEDRMAAAASLLDFFNSCSPENPPTGGLQPATLRYISRFLKRNLSVLHSELNDLEKVALRRKIAAALEQAHAHGHAEEKHARTGIDIRQTIPGVLIGVQDYLGRGLRWPSHEAEDIYKLIDADIRKLTYRSQDEQAERALLDALVAKLSLLEGAEPKEAESAWQDLISGMSNPFLLRKVRPAIRNEIFRQLSSGGTGSKECRLALVRNILEFFKLHLFSSQDNGKMSADDCLHISMLLEEHVNLLERQLSGEERAALIKELENVRDKALKQGLTAEYGDPDENKYTPPRSIPAVLNRVLYSNLISWFDDAAPSLAKQSEEEHDLSPTKLSKDG